MKHLFLNILRAACMLTALAGNGQPAQDNRWTIRQNGGIQWNVTGRLPHSDHIEMSGEQVSLWLEYGVDTLGQPTVRRTVIFPSFRLKPNDTHASLMRTFTDADLPAFLVDGQPLKPRLLNGSHLPGLRETVGQIVFDGVLEIQSLLKPVKAASSSKGLVLKRKLFPSVKRAAAFERFVFINQSERAVTVAMEYKYTETRTDTLLSVDGPLAVVQSTGDDGSKSIQPGDSAAFQVTYQAVRHLEKPTLPDAWQEEQQRRERVAAIWNGLEIQTPDPVLNTAFAFAKLRATESIFKTKNGYVNSPGGLTYYAGIWANDQAEYAGPYFAYAGDPLGAEASVTAYDWFARYMNPAYKPIPSSIIAEGTGYWNGAGDRGDQAMIAYGAARFALARGDAKTANRLWPLIEWCLAFCYKKINAEGVVDSDSDELEGRFPAGKANLATSCLYYDALLSAAMLSKDLGKPKAQTNLYLEQAGKLRKAIEAFFGADVAGYPTYRYYNGNTTLRSWICMPLTVGLFERKEGTVNALFSPTLWTSDGLATEAGSTVFWDRSTLYALRGVLASGATNKGIDYLTYYSNRRLLGEHVPYPVEAYPEGNQRHLATESALYCRIYTEGLFGLRPTGLHSFAISPTLPSKWNFMRLQNVDAFGEKFDIVVDRQARDTKVTILRPGKETLSFDWNGKKPIQVNLHQ
ncbi:hypothetical protein LZD49_20550 [Dyadobacter sp. CY261]|uniref:hypothetical protein n=1 Tax=Dyadobacter sp. CY261 TaxID=2907203 RepID=UPI001F33E774|nr:hypothetical protein [Dyadobacter sp. CY261]MCF0072881.1 hypothetical protein [Dyadobacter sp. CY261]